MNLVVGGGDDVVVVGLHNEAGPVEHLDSPDGSRPPKNCRRNAPVGRVVHNHAPVGIEVTVRLAEVEVPAHDERTAAGVIAPGDDRRAMVPVRYSGRVAGGGIDLAGEDRLYPIRCELGLGVEGESGYNLVDDGDMRDRNSARFSHAFYDLPVLLRVEGVLAHAEIDQLLFGFETDDETRLADGCDYRFVHLRYVCTHESPVLPAHLAVRTFDPDDGDIPDLIETCVSVRGNQRHAVDACGWTHRLGDDTGLAGTVLLRGTACSEQEDEQGCQGQRNNIRFQDQPLLG